MSFVRKIRKPLITYITCSILLFSILSIGYYVKLSTERKEVEKNIEYAYTTKKNGDIYYQIFVRSFNDSNNDGIGDLNGITNKLDYLENLGITGIWLSPIYESPSYHGYDVIDYKEINSDFGTIDDFKNLLKECHNRNIKIILDYIPNHTSDQHEWFKEAISSEENKYRDYYVWADENTDLSTISPVGNKAWANSGNTYYYNTFWSGMPDLNFDNPEVQKEIIETAKWWLDIGVDGFRIDAALHIYEPDRFDDSIAWWDYFRKSLAAYKKDTYLIGEIWSSPGVITSYFNVMDSCFNFNIGKPIISAVNSGFAIELRGDLRGVYKNYSYEITDSYVDAPFLTNHDMNRVMSLVTNENQGKVAASIYLTLPGNPFIYYGEEIGMKGKKPDEYLREPFIWNGEGKDGETSWEQLKYNIDTTPANQQLDDSQSILSHYKDLINYRKEDITLTSGDIEFIKSHGKFLSFYRYTEEATHLVIHNVSADKVEAQFKIDKELAGSVIETFNSTENIDFSYDNGQIKISLPPYSSVLIK
ncbi:alpha-amylase family glycosyl hydrolase [Oceanirhabdus sp. W0125-5]|uniref:alpha-amylase family glycosyl hydrolase n=1 Tax=Oceanirhabdus sp. W0125-5 TaxID=2999116 RepID=UPI0022F32E93|nr:alpha-amylase family glycosyl hydrolase [Oceanirhabdus sp. W0125-5]WBW95513.1 alpha-amylase family glycosyl hydrolase [Oceanirhabdus sp. W0125-5]